MTVYRNGRPVLVDAPSAPKREVITRDQRAIRDLVSWLPIERRQRLLETSFAAVLRYSTPPSGESFFSESGDPYSDPAQFAEDLAQEFRERLFEVLGNRDADGGHYLLLGEPSAERVGVRS